MTCVSYAQSTTRERGVSTERRRGKRLAIVRFAEDETETFCGAGNFCQHHYFLLILLVKVFFCVFVSLYYVRLKVRVSRSCRSSRSAYASVKSVFCLSECVSGTDCPFDCLPVPVRPLPASGQRRPAQFPRIDSNHHPPPRRNYFYSRNNSIGNNSKVYLAARSTRPVPNTTATALIYI